MGKSASTPPVAVPSPGVRGDDSGEADSQNRTIVLDDESPTVVGGPGDLGTVAEHPPVGPGTVIERYLVIEHIGAGGLGDVYAAYDPELDRKIAIKLLKPLRRLDEDDNALGDPTSRLLREAQAMARLQHRSVVTVFDVGTFDGQVFMAMEFVQGETLSHWFRGKNRPWREVRDVLLSAGQGLAAAHGANLVHRDFKPQNVIVGNDGRVVVLDFGLARAVEPTDFAALERRTPAEIDTPSSQSLLEQEMTEVGVLLGTPPYMAPELFGGSSGSGLSDQFAFCVTLYEALYGQRPFRSKSLGEHIRMVREGELYATQRPNRDVPAWLHRVVLQGLRPKAADRFGSMEALLQALLTDRRRRRRRVMGLVIAVPLLSAVGAVGVVALRPGPTQAEVDRVSSLTTEARAAAALGYYVHPPPDEPDRPTAYVKILELETLSGAVSKDAGLEAGRLRDEMASALVRLGDKYYDRPGGPPFAADFYASALVFDPKNDRARTRAAVTRGELASLRTKAASGEFSASELAAAEPLAVLADGNSDGRREKVRRLFGREEGAAQSTRERLESLLDPDERGVAVAESRKRSRKRGRDSGGQVADAPMPRRGDLRDPFPNADGGETPAPEPVAPSPGEVAPPKPGASQPAVPRRDAKAAAAAAKLGRAALRKGKLSPASSHFHTALGHDRRNVMALEGLTDLHFERGEYEKAVTFAKRATSVAPRRSGLQVKLGDAYVKVLRYSDARRAYEAAKTLGSSTAQKRLDRLTAKTGG